jgi:hypothetical protein
MAYNFGSYRNPTGEAKLEPVSEFIVAKHTNYIIFAHGGDIQEENFPPNYRYMERSFVLPPTLAHQMVHFSFLAEEGCNLMLTVMNPVEAVCRAEMLVQETIVTGHTMPNYELAGNNHFSRGITRFGVYVCDDETRKPRLIFDLTDRLTTVQHVIEQIILSHGKTLQRENAISITGYFCRSRTGESMPLHLWQGDVVDIVGLRSDYEPPPARPIILPITGQVVGPKDPATLEYFKRQREAFWNLPSRSGGFKKQKTKKRTSFFKNKKQKTKRRRSSFFKNKKQKKCRLTK